MEDLVQFQIRSLKSVISRLYELNSSYRAKMDGAGVHPRDFEKLADLARFPFTTKQDLRQNYPLGYLTVPRENLVRVHSSSGSHGHATISAYSAKDIEAWSRLMSECLVDFGVGPKDTVLVTHGYGLFTGGLGVHYGAEKLGCLVVPASTGQTAKQVDLIRDLGVTVIVGSPSYMLKLAEEIGKAEFPPGQNKLRLCICGSEPWSEHLRSAVENALKVPAYDLYGISEVIGPGVASEHHRSPGALMVRENHFYPEIIGGELVVSTLTKEAMPLLRYRTGDCTAWSKAAAAPYRFIERIAGRNDDLIKIKGVAVYPLQIEEILLKDKNLNGNYVIEITRPQHLDVLTIRAEEKTAGSVQSSALAAAVRKTLGITAEIFILPAGALPPQSGKAKRLFDLRKDT